MRFKSHDNPQKLGPECPTVCPEEFWNGLVASKEQWIGQPLELLSNETLGVTMIATTIADFNITEYYFVVMGNNYGCHVDMRETTAQADGPTAILLHWGNLRFRIGKKEVE